MSVSSPGPVPGDGLDYFRAKGVKPSFDYRDVWREEHAAAFTVAKAMQADLLMDLREAVDSALERGETFDRFSKSLRPVLEKQGWWGRREMLDPKTGKVVDAQLGSPRRLLTIYNANLRTARAAGQWQRIQRSRRTHPWLLYRIGPSKEHRLEHVQWNGVLLPVDDPWWLSHFPPNGWGCKCHVRQISQREHDRLTRSGKVTTTAPPLSLREWVNKRTGETELVPSGIDPGWGTNPGALRTAALKHQLKQKEKALDAALKRPLPPHPQRLTDLDDLLAAGASIRRELAKARSADGKVDETAFRATLRERLAQVRPMAALVKTAGGGKGAALVKSVSKWLPDDWLRRSDEAGRLRVRFDGKGRGWAWTAKKTGPVRLAKYGVVDAAEGDGFLVVRDAGNALHELMHRIQSVYPELDELFQALHRRRTAGEALVSLKALKPDRDYSPDELARPDNYLTPYQGREYADGGALEVMTIAFEYALGRRGLLLDMLEKDREMLDLVLAVLFHF